MIRSTYNSEDKNFNVQIFFFYNGITIMCTGSDKYFSIINYFLFGYKINTKTKQIGFQI